MHLEIKPISRVIIHSFFILVCLMFVIPFIAVLAISFSDSQSIIYEGYSLIPRGFNTIAYEYLLRQPEKLLRAYGVTFFITIAGCLLGLLVNALIAYPLSRSNFKYKKPVMLMVALSMFFNGGLVPTYILISQYLHWKDTLWVMIIPGLCVPWFIILLRTFFRSIPYALMESAMIDGAGEWRIFMSIVVPLSKPALATIGLFLSLGYWNEWYTSLLYINKPDLFPLQYLLYRYMADAQMMVNEQARLVVSGIDYSKLPTESMRMAMCILAAGPMLFIFPFFQKYFVKGLTVGALKE